MADGRVLSFRPEPGFYHKRAEKSIEKGDYTAALKNLRRAVEMEPDKLSLRLDIADTYARMGLYERSNLEIFTRNPVIHTLQSGRQFKSETILPKHNHQFLFHWSFTAPGKDFQSLRQRLPRPQSAGQPQSKIKNTVSK